MAQMFEERDNVVEDYYNKPIRVSDAAGMLRKRVGKNVPPYLTEMVECNNALVTDWQRNVLNEKADPNGNIPSGSVERLWRIYFQGIQARKAENILIGEQKDAILRANDNVINWWLDSMRGKSIKELCDMGILTLHMGWGIVQNELKMRMMKEEFDKVYSQSDDPLDWEDLFKKDGRLGNTRNDAVEFLPFSSSDVLKDIEEKIKVIMNVRVTIDTNSELVKDGKVSMKNIAKIMRMNPPRNCLPYVKEMLEYNNNMVNLFKECVDTLRKAGSQFITTDDMITLEELDRLWRVYYQGTQTLRIYKTKAVKFIPVIPQESINYWLDMLLNKSITELHNFGITTIMFAWNTIQHNIKMSKYWDTYTRVFSHDKNTWFDPENSKILDAPTKIGNITKHDLNEVQEKISYLFKIRVDSNN